MEQHLQSTEARAELSRYPKLEWIHLLTEDQIPLVSKHAESFLCYENHGECGFHRICQKVFGGIWSVINGWIHSLDGSVFNMY